ncbi:MAG: heparan-alpha-glucosaminide N-acetyltransferase domain-containing protein [Myxococcaceae bacterium]
MPPSPAAGSAARIRAFDWLRGLAVLFMIQCHALVLLLPALRQGPLFHRLVWLDGLVAPSFLFAAGFSLALVQVRGAAAGTRGKRLLKTTRRLGEVLLVASLVNTMWFPTFREPHWLLRIDILHCIGVSLLLALPLTAGLATRPRLLSVAALLLAALTFGAAPLAEGVTGPLAPFANASTGSVFPLLPWAGYVYLGAAVGAAAAAGVRSTVRWLLGLLVLGAATWSAAPLFLQWYPKHNFWVTDPANHGQRLFYVCLVVLGLLAFEHWARAGWRKSAPVRFVETFGTSSMAAYFFHEALLYYRVFGFSFQAWWGQSCGWGKYAALTALLIGMTYLLSLLTDRVYRGAGRAWDSARARP